MVDGKKEKRKKTFGDPTYKQFEGVSMSFNPIEVFQKSKDLKGDIEENE